MIPVTKPFLPPIDEYKEYVDGIWQRQWLTNNGPLVNDLELTLKEYLRVSHMLFVSNGTIAIQLAIKALELTGEIITTPFSYVATTSSIVWEGCKPIFVDIDQNTLNIDPTKIEASITDKTSAILATHVYGNPCDIDAIEEIANKHKLKVIYDAAHCFGSLYKGKSVFCYGDICTTSFHATKLFHTTEGGAIFTNSAELLKKISHMRNFGHDGPEKFLEVGINGKNSEFHAAMGLVNMKYVDDILRKRQEMSERYDIKLENFKAERIVLDDRCKFNHAYYPIVLPSEEMLNRVIDTLNINWIYPRRYFYPSLNNLHYVEKSSCPVSEDVSKRVLCLPLYYTLTKEDVDVIARLMLRTQNN